MASLSIHAWRWCALGGLAIVLLVDGVASARTPTGLGLGLGVLIVFPVVVTLASLLLMPRAAGTLIRNGDLLVPLALVIFAAQLLQWLAAAPLLGTLLTSSFPLRFLNLSFAVSLNLLLHIVLAVAYATWMTGAVIELVRTGNGDPYRMLPSVLARFWRMFGVEFIGWAAVMVATAAMLLLMPMLGAVALVPMLAFAMAWNFTTAAALPVAWQESSGFWRSLRAGVVTSLTNGRKWALLVVAQMLLLGLAFVWYSRISDSRGIHTSFNWSVNAFWTGGYEDECRWYGKLAGAFHTSKLPIVETLLRLVFGAFAVAIKIAIVQRLQPEPPPAATSEPGATSSTVPEPPLL